MKTINNSLRTKSFMVLVAVNVALFLKAVSYQYVNFDDDTYLNYLLSIDNLLFYEALSRIFTDTVNANWHPITVLSFYIDWKIASLNPGYFHFINILIHIVNSVVLYAILKKLDFGKSALIIALLFSVHPIQVEAVVWVSERKGLLSALFSFASIYFYLCSKEKYKNRNLLFALLFYILGVMSKASLVILPVIFIAIDYFQLGYKEFKENTMLLLKEKTLFFIAGIIFSVVTILIHAKSGVISGVDNFNLSERFINSILAYKNYIVDVFYPVNLSVFYPYIRGVNLAELIFSVLLIALVFWASFLLRKKKPYILFGWAWFFASLLPVIGLIKTGAHAYADRYMYFPSIGLFIIIVLALEELIIKTRISLKILWGVVILVLSGTSFIQIQYWENSFTLFERALSVTSDNYIAHRNLSSAYLSVGEIDIGMKHYYYSKNIRKKSKDLYLVVSDKLINANRIDLADGVLTDMLNAGYDDYKIYLTLGQIRINRKMYKEAIEALKLAEGKKPDDFSILYSLGAAYYFVGNNIDSSRYLEKAYKINQSNRQNLQLLVTVFDKLNKENQVEFYSKILQQINN